MLRFSVSCFFISLWFSCTRTGWKWKAYRSPPFCHVRWFFALAFFNVFLQYSFICVWVRIRIEFYAVFSLSPRTKNVSKVHRHFSLCARAVLCARFANSLFGWCILLSVDVMAFVSLAERKVFNVDDGFFCSRLLLSLLFFSFTNLKLDSDFIRFMAKWLGHKTKVIKNEKKRDNPKHLRFCQFLWTLVGPHVTIANGMRVCVRERIVNSFWYARNLIRTK